MPKEENIEIDRKAVQSNWKLDKLNAVFHGLFLFIRFDGPGRIGNIRFALAVARVSSSIIAGVSASVPLMYLRIHATRKVSGFTTA